MWQGVRVSVSDSRVVLGLCQMPKRKYREDSLVIDSDRTSQFGWEVKKGPFPDEEDLSMINVMVPCTFRAQLDQSTVAAIVRNVIASVTSAHATLGLRTASSNGSSSRHILGGSICIHRKHDRSHCADVQG